jgi:HD-GYP domain-containing protein (c-di-GMP phosphodiesterase class II)
VCLLSINIAAAMGYNEEQIQEIGTGALLHDIGMLLIPREIWQKEARLDESEWFEVMKHPMLGLHVLENVTRLPASVPLIAYQAHERINGRGYPKQRHSRLIHHYAQIVQIADVYEALASPRPYRGPYIPYKAMEMVVRMTRTGFFHNEKTRLFIEYASLFPVGSLVELTDGRIAKVIKANGSHYTKPQLSVLTDEHGTALPKDEIYQLDLVNGHDDGEVGIVRAHPSDYVPRRGVMDGF